MWKIASLFCWCPFFFRQELGTQNKIILKYYTNRAHAYAYKVKSWQQCRTSKRSNWLEFTRYNWCPHQFRKCLDQIRIKQFGIFRSQASWKGVSRAVYTFENGCATGSRPKEFTKGQKVNQSTSVVEVKQMSCYATSRGVTRVWWTIVPHTAAFMHWIASQTYYKVIALLRTFYGGSLHSNFICFTATTLGWRHVKELYT